LRSDHQERVQALPVIGNWLRNVAPSNDLSSCHEWLIWQYFYRHAAAPAAQRKDHLFVVMPAVSPEPLAARASMF
jgi:hypothetical protein